MCEVTLFTYRDKLIGYENGLLSSNGIVFLFSYLISSSEIFNLSKKHRDTAQGFISYGLMDSSGKIEWDKYYKLFDKE